MARLLLLLGLLAIVASACDAEQDTDSRGATATTDAVSATPKAGAPAPPATCPVSDQSLVREGLALAMGRSPVWMVAAPVRAFEPAPPVEESAASKVIWVVDDGVQGEVRITGRRLDGAGIATFPVYERDPQYAEQRRAGSYELRWDRTELVLVAPYGREQDHRTQVYYPSAGCWQFTARTESGEVRFVQYLYEEPS